MLNQRDEGWTDEMLGPAEKTLDSLHSGDMIRYQDDIRKILVAVDGCYLLSHTQDYNACGTWYTAAELKKLGCQVFDPNNIKDTIEIDGEKYDKSEVKEAIKDLEPIDLSDTDS